MTRRCHADAALDVEIQMKKKLMALNGDRKWRGTKRMDAVT